MKLTTKKIIAREGLIILSIGVIGCLFFFIGDHFHSVLENKFNNLSKPEFDIKKLTGEKPITKTVKLNETLFLISFFNTMYQIGVLLLLFGYPFYLLSRFIIWAIRTLKQKE